MSSNAEYQPEAPPSGRRWFQYGLRTLLVVMVLASIAMSWLAMRLQQAERQRQAVEVIERRGGSIAWSPFAHGPDWLQELLGRECFRTIVYVSASDTEFADADMASLSILPAVNCLELDRTRITDAGMVNVKDLKRLELLSLAGTQVGDSGLEHLGRLSELVQLILHGTRITDAGLQHLSGLNHLQSLDLTRTHVTHEGVQKLQQALPKCRIAAQPPTADERQCLASPDQLR